MSQQFCVDHVTVAQISRLEVAGTRTDVGTELSMYPMWRLLRVKQQHLHWQLLFLMKKLHVPT